MNEKTQQILDIVKELTILELADLVKELENEFGVSAAPAEDEKTEFDVELTAFDEAKKLKVIKAIKDITGVSKEEAEELKKQLEEQGATVTIK